ncbi:MAG: glycoside hydrolase family 1 protein [Candidatus Magasanikbacteria bacterium]
MQENKIEKQFPKNFYWGCSTSAHQIEGGLKNDWSEWEKSNKRLEELKNKNLNPLDFISDKASNSFENNNADIACMKDLHLNAYRFSLDWSRIEPEEGKFDESALEYYLHFVKKLKLNNIEPFVTLWHWPIPLWMRDKGGWESREIVFYFSRFTKKVVEYLNDEVDYWVTLNEPMVYSSMSYLKGFWPPQKKSIWAMMKVLKNLVLAHKQAYRVIKDIGQKNQVGIAKHNIYFEAYQNKFVNKFLKLMADWWWNNNFLQKIVDTQDFIGLNYYFHSKIDYGFGKAHVYNKISDLGWGLHPEGIYHVLKDLQKFAKPIYIMENGLADKGDQYRSWYIREILSNVYKAIKDDVDVRGYFHWSLIDNFEWAEGFHPRFGLYEVDFRTFERKARSSAEYYRDICKNNRIV